MLLSVGFCCFPWVLGSLFCPPTPQTVTLKADCGVVAHAPDVTSHCPGFRPFTRSARRLYRGHIHIATAGHETHCIALNKGLAGSRWTRVPHSDS